ncbi:MAG: hypothetical protein KDC34_07470 [Saprospiraceae bacterium]|nr:hypothetical protein [Saprospiraceae bacterium]
MKANFASINRFALIIRAKKPLIAWVNEVFPDDPVDFDALQGHDHLEVFLIPEFPDLEEAQEWLETNYLSFLEYILETWCADSDIWPEIRNWTLFEKLLDYSIESLVIDTVDDEYDEEE